MYEWQDGGIEVSPFEEQAAPAERPADREPPAAADHRPEGRESEAGPEPVYQLKLAAPKGPLRCDQLLWHLEATVTNPSSFPMRLCLASAGGRSDFHVSDIRDADGFPLLFDLRCDLDEPETAAGAAKSWLIAPGTSVRVPLTFAGPPLAWYWQDPSRAAKVSIYGTVAPCPGSRERVWLGDMRGECPLRLVCPYREWAEGLVRPAGRWAVSIGARSGVDWAPVVTTPRSGLWLAFRFRHNAERRGDWGPDHLLTAEEAEALAACCRVVREGRALPGPAPRPAVLAALLAALEGEFHEFRLDLARYYSLGRPGVYRVRCALPGTDPPSLSNKLEVVVLGVPEQH
jgi:hypothetical protein